MKFNIIVAIDSDGGIAKNGNIPWSCKDDMNLFRRITIGGGNNAIVMGRKTHETIGRLLPNRHNIIISTQSQNIFPVDISVYSSLDTCLTDDGLSVYDEIFIIGGQMIYEQCLTKYMNMCDKVYISEFHKSYNCDQTFPMDLISHLKYHIHPITYSDFDFYVLKV